MDGDVAARETPALASKLHNRDLRANNVAFKAGADGDVRLIFAHGRDTEHNPVVDERHYSREEFKLALSDLVRWRNARFGRNAVATDV